jgi:CRP-like cAMP-binding protein
MRSSFEGEEGTEGWHRRNKAFLGQELVAEDVSLARDLTLKAEPIELRPTDTLYEKGNPAEFIYFILRGCCELTNDGKLVALLKKGQSLGETPFVDGLTAYTVTATAREQSVLARVPYADFRVIVSKHPIIWRTMAEKLSYRLRDRLVEDDAREHLVILVHGIRTFAPWEQALKPALIKAGLKVESTNFEYFDVIRFLMPFEGFRRKKIALVQRQLRQAIRLHPNAIVSIIAHSFGSYIVAEILAEEPDILVHRVIFCGSTVPSDHRFVRQIGAWVKTQVVNDVGSKDVWPALAMSITSGYGHTGTYGFRIPAVKDRWFAGFEHSDFLKPEFCEKNWIPFLTKGTVPMDEASPPDDPPLWLWLLSVFQIKIMVPLLVLGTLIWWKWDYVSHLVSRSSA